MVSLLMDSFGVIHFMTGRNIRKLVMHGGFRELHIARKLTILYVLTILEVLMNISQFLMVIQLREMDIGKKVQATTYLRQLKSL